MTGSGRPVNTGSDWMRNVERRLAQVERRGRPNSGSVTSAAGDLTSNWNQNLTSGFYFSLAGALNSPDGTKRWIGYVAVDSEGEGVQQITRYGPGVSPQTYVRTFTGAPVPTFTAWTAL